MYLIQEILVSEELFARKFVCNLSKCQGACCYEGDFGAPLQVEEKEILDKIDDAVKPYLPKEQQELLAQKGGYQYDKEYGGDVTTVMPDGACVYMTRNELGHAQCGIEQAYRDGKIDFRKPISCHLYPIRAKENKEIGFHALNYDEWDICSAACALGEELKVPVFRFAKAAIIRAYGQDFYDELEAVYEGR